MKEQKKSSFREVERRVESVRRIYSRIGEPLPVDIIIDLYRHLGSISVPVGKTEKKKRIQ